MKRRYVYALLFSVPALLAALIIGLLSFGTVAGAVWLFVLGDSPWPKSVEAPLVALFVLVAAALWLALLSLAYRAGKQREVDAAISSRPVIAAAGATALLALLAVVQQWSVGNLGAKSEGVLCSDYCKARGFMSSGTPPRNSGLASCSCFDAQGREALTLPMAEIASAPGR